MLRLRALGPRVLPRAAPAVRGPPMVRMLSTQEFHKAADATLDQILTSYEFLQESVPQIETEYSNGVLNLKMPPAGTWVVNKQPPNKQLWLASPVSGPKRFDFVEGTWVYPREKVTLGEVLREETLKTVDHAVDLPIA